MNLLTFTSVFDLALELHSWGLRPDLALIGASAGVDHILSVLLVFRRYKQPFKLSYLVAIAGAFHETLYDVAKDVFLRDRTNIIVHHHPKDTLCPFPPVAAYWEKLRSQMPGHVFIHALECHDRQLLDNKYHDVAKFLCSQAVFWDRLRIEHDPKDDLFERQCRILRLGQSHLTIKKSSDYIVGYDRGLSDRSHLLQQALVAYKAMRHAVYKVQQPTSVLKWTIEIALRAGALFSRQSFHEVEEFRASFPDAGAGVQWSNRLPRSLFGDAMMGLVQGQQPGILKAGYMQYKSPTFSMIQSFGPLALLKMTFPKEANNRNQWANLGWTEVVMPLSAPNQRRTYFPDVKDKLKRRCVRNGSLSWVPENDGEDKRELTFRDNIDNAEDWVRVSDDDKINEGLRPGDIVSILLGSGRERNVCHIFGLIDYSHAYKRTGQPTQAQWSSSISFWCHTNCVKDSLFSERDDNLYITSFICFQTQQSLKVAHHWGYAARQQPLITKILRSDCTFDTEDHPMKGNRSRLVGVIYADKLHTVKTIPFKVITALRSVVAIVNGPPGTGKTFQAGTIVSTMNEAAKSTKMRTLWVTWTNAALHNLLRSALRYGVKASTCVLVCRPESLPSDITGVKVLQLNGDLANLIEWRRLFSKEQPILNVFCTIGQTLNPPAHFERPLDHFNGAFNFTVVDEAGQVLEIYGQHLPKYASQLLLCGDVAQLPGHSYLHDEHFPLMRAASTSITPVFLNAQYRQNEGLAKFNSCLSYNGMVHDAVNYILPKATSLQFILVLFQADRQEKESSPSRRSFALGTALWHAFGFKKATARIITPYAKQNKLYNRNGRDMVCEVIDAVQGIEVDDTIIDLGRNHGVGFLRDPRRMNVALTRARHRVIVIAHEDLGLYNYSGFGHDYWYHFRKACSNLNLIQKVGLHERPRSVASRLHEEMNLKQALNQRSVSEAFNEVQPFFAEYMSKVAGQFAEMNAIPDSDHEDYPSLYMTAHYLLPIHGSELIHSTDTLTQLDADISTDLLDLIENNMNEEADEENEIGHNEDEQDNDVDEDLSHKAFIGVCVQNIYSLLEAATKMDFDFNTVTKETCMYHTPGPRHDCTHCQTLQRGRGAGTNNACYRHSYLRYENMCHDCYVQRLKAHDECRKIVTRTFAAVLHRSLRQTYTQRELSDEEFPYPKRVGSFTLQSLYNDKGNCEKFLQALWNTGSGQSSSDGSALFYQYGIKNVRQDCTSPDIFLKQISWQLVLPYGTVGTRIRDIPSFGKGTLPTLIFKVGGPQGYPSDLSPSVS